MKFRLLKFRAYDRLCRAGRAWHYLWGTWTEDQARLIRWDAQNRECYYPLIAISWEGVRQHLADAYGDLPMNTVDLAQWATRRTADKWSSDGEEYYAALDDAQSRAEQYARETGNPFPEAL